MRLAVSRRRAYTNISDAIDEEGSGPNPIEWLLVKLDRLSRRIENRPLAAESETVAKAPEV